MTTVLQERQLRNAIQNSTSERVELQEITPAIARLFLDYNTNNRRQIKERIAKYAAQIRNGEFMLSNDMIVFSRTGVLLNGQNRLEAIIAADQPIRSVVAYGYEDMTFTRMDIGKPRSAADAVRYDYGELKNANSIAAIVRNVSAFRKIVARAQQAGTPISWRMPKYEAHEVSKLLDELGLEAVERSHDKAYRPAANNSIPQPSVVAAMHFLASQKDSGTADDFFQRFATGLDIQKNEPVWQARKQLIRYDGSKPRAPEIVSTLTQMWNKQRTKGMKSGRCAPILGVIEDFV